MLEPKNRILEIQEKKIQIETSWYQTRNLDFGVNWNLRTFCNTKNQYGAKDVIASFWIRYWIQALSMKNCW